MPLNNFKKPIPNTVHWQAHISSAYLPEVRASLRRLLRALNCTFALLFATSLHAGDQPQWGQRDTRNMVSRERNLPATFDPKTGANVKWVVPIGTESYSTPVVANGRIYIGTNNGQPRDPKHKGDRGVLMCFEEKTGNFLWQMVAPKREDDQYYDWPNTGMSSPVTVEGNRVYHVDNRGEVVCLDPKALANGNDGPYRDEARHMTVREKDPLELGKLDADILWLCDLVKTVGIWSHDGAHSSILVHDRYLYVNSGTGVDNTHRKIRTPDAPSLVVIDKNTGQLVARDQEGIAPNIFHCTWSSPSFATVKGQPLIFFAGGNGILYAFEPFKPARNGTDSQAALKKVWQYDPDPNGPKEQVHRFTSNRRESPSNVYGMPVVVDGRIYLACGGDLFWGKNEAWLKCIDAATGKEVWSYPLEKHVLSTPAVKDGLIYISDCGRMFHCVDAKTGTRIWTQDVRGDVWASPMVSDGKVYLGTRSGEFWVFAEGREKRVLNHVEFGDPISGTATMANGVVYVATMRNLFAFQAAKR